MKLHSLDGPFRTVAQALEDSRGLKVEWIDAPDCAGYVITFRDQCVSDCVFKDEETATQVAVEIAGALSCD